MRICVLLILLGACGSAPRRYTVRTDLRPDEQRVVSELANLGYTDARAVAGTIYATARTHDFQDVVPLVRRDAGSYDTPREEIVKRSLVVAIYDSGLVLQIRRSTCIRDGSSLTGACSDAGDATTDERSRTELEQTGRALERRLGRTRR